MSAWISGRGWCYSKFNILKKTGGEKETFFKDFHQLGPLGRVGLVVAMCVSLFLCIFVCLMSPSHVIFLCGRTGAERASSGDWCNLDLE